MATCSSVLAWKILWTEEPGGLQSMVSQRVRHEHARTSLILRKAKERRKFWLSERPIWASQVVLVVKNPPANAGRRNRRGFNPWVGKIPWKRAWQPTPVFLPGKSHGQSSLVGYSP